MFNIPKKVQKGTLNYSTNPWQMEKNSVKLWYMNGMFSWPTKIQKMAVAGHLTWIYQSESGFTQGCGSCFCWTDGFKYQTFGFKHPKYGFHQQNMGLDFWISPGFFHQPKQKKFDQQHREIQQSLQGPLFGWSLRMRFRTHRQGPTVVAWHRGFGGPVLGRIGGEP